MTDNTQQAALIKEVRDLLSDCTQGYSTPLPMQQSFKAQYWEKYAPLLCNMLEAATRATPVSESHAALAEKIRIKWPDRSDDLKKAAKIIASMVEEWVDVGLQHGTDWRKGLADIIASRLQRLDDIGRLPDPALRAHPAGGVSEEQVRAADAAHGVAMSEGKGWHEAMREALRAAGIGAGVDLSKTHRILDAVGNLMIALDPHWEWPDGTAIGLDREVMTCIGELRDAFNAAAPSHDKG